MTDQRPRSDNNFEVKPRAYDPMARPELFEGVLTRRVLAFIVDVLIIAIPILLVSIFHFPVRDFHPRVRLAAVLAGQSGIGDLGHRLLRNHHGQSRLGHLWDARVRSRDPHLVWRPLLFPARRRACDPVLGLDLGAHALRGDRGLLDFLLGTVVVNSERRAAEMRRYGR
jgi:hypothetical protein